MKKIITMALLAVTMTMSADIHPFNNIASASYKPGEIAVIKYLNPLYAKMLSYGEFSDTNPIQLQTCEKILDECVELKILDKKGRRYYKHLKHIHSVSLEIELIEECMQEDKFLDVIMERDEWLDYQELVYLPRNL